MGISKNYAKEVKEKLAQKEELNLVEIEKELDDGTLVILGNKKNCLKEEFNPLLVGNLSTKKVCVAIGMDSNSVEHFNEQELEVILQAKPDAVCDVSIGNNIPKALEKIRGSINVPLGSCPTYDIFTPNIKFELKKEEILEKIEKHLMAGVDFILLHFGVNQSIVKNLEKSKRIMPITSRGGGDIIRYMKKFNCENPLLQYYDSIGDLCRKYGVVLDLGDVFRTGCIEDGEEILEKNGLKYQEVMLLAEIRKNLIKNGVAVVCEGGGHMPLNVIPKFSEWMKKNLDNAPIWYNGPLPTDRAVSYDSVANAIGSCVCAINGGDMFLALTDAEHYTKPSPYQSAQAIRTMKVMVSCVEYSRGNIREIELNHKMGKCRQERNWEGQINYSLYPQLTSNAFKKYGLTENAKPCSLCGAHCPLLIFNKKGENNGTD